MNTFQISPSRRRSRRPPSLDERLTEIRWQIKRLDAYCHALGRDPRTIQRSVFLTDPGVWANQGRLDYYPSVDAFKDVVTRYQALGMDKCLIAYPGNEDQLPVFQQIARDVIPELQTK